MTKTQTIKMTAQKAFMGNQLDQKLCRDQAQQYAERGAISPGEYWDYLRESITLMSDSERADEFAAVRQEQ